MPKVIAKITAFCFKLFLFLTYLYKIRNHFDVGKLSVYRYQTKIGILVHPYFQCLNILKEDNTIH